MKEIRIKSAIPIYAAGGAWLLYSCLLPMYRITDIIIAGAFSVIVYMLLSKIIPSKVLLMPVETTFNKTGNAETDEVVSRGKEYIDAIKRYNSQIESQTLKNDINKIISLSERIFGFISKNPGNTGQIKTFMNYYYPTTVKLLDSFTELRNQPVTGGNISDSIEKIESVMGSIVKAFEKQLDNLYEDKALDIKTDIAVLKSILASEGFEDSGIMGGQAQ